MNSPPDIVVMGASQGGLAALSEILSGLPADLPAALLIVLHTAEGPRLLAHLLGKCTRLPVAYGEEGVAVEPGHVYIAQPSQHLMVLPPGILHLDPGPRVSFSRPAADVLFRSAAQVYGPRVIGVVLTGGDGDGADGMRAIEQAGGHRIVQQPEDSLNPSMPRSALKSDHPEYVLPLKDIAPLLVHLITGQAAPKSA